MRGSTIALYVNRSLLKTVTDDSIRAKGTVSVFVASETNLPATFTVSRFTILTPEKAIAEWGSGPASSAPPVVSSSPPTVPPTLAARPGLYVASVRLNPGPKRGVDIGFNPMFLNTTGGTQNYRVKVYIYRPDNLRNSFGETSAGIIMIPVGTSEQSVRDRGNWVVVVAVRIFSSASDGSTRRTASPFSTSLMATSLNPTPRYAHKNVTLESPAMIGESEFG